MVLITPQYANRELNNDFPIAPLEAVMYDYFALDSAQAHIGVAPNLDGINWIKMCVVTLGKYSETAILDSMMKLLDECFAVRFSHLNLL